MSKKNNKKINAPESFKDEIGKVLFSRNVIAKLVDKGGLTKEDDDALKDLWFKLDFLEEKFRDHDFVSALPNSIETAKKANLQIYEFAIAANRELN